MSPLTLVELAALGATALPAVRLLARRSVRVTFPRLWLTLVLTLCASAAAVVALAVWAPLVLHVLTPVAVALAIGAAVRARPAAGRRRGLPPGSLSLSASLEALADRRFYLNRSRRHGPVFKMAQVTRPTACVVGLGRGHQLMREQGAAIRNPPLPFSAEIEGGFLRYMDDETHDRYGPLFRRALARPVVAVAEGVASECARRELAALARRCEVSHEAVPPGHALATIVHATYLKAFLGIDPGSTAESEFQDAYAPVERWSLSGALGARERTALERLRAVMRAQLDRGEEDVSVLSELKRLDPSMPDETALDNLVFMLKIAVSNTTGLLHWVIAFLGREPGWLDRLVVAPHEPEGEDLLGNVVSETLRLAQSEYLYREVTDDIPVDGHLVPKGWLLRICVWESHRDPAVFDDPESFDPRRFAGRRTRDRRKSRYPAATPSDEMTVDRRGLSVQILALRQAECLAPHQPEGEDLLGNVVSENIRLAQSEYLYREVTDDIPVDGHLVPKGWLLRICVWESHRDPAVFDDPESFDPRRFAGRRFATDEYAPFGLGRHACNGIAVNDLVCRAVLTALVGGYSWRVAGDGQPTHDLRHWHHWRTSPGLALLLEPKPATVV